MISGYYKPDIRSKRFSTSPCTLPKTTTAGPPAPSAALLPQPAALAHDSRPSSRLEAIKSTIWLINSSLFSGSMRGGHQINDLAYKLFSLFR